jgi:hypothetical protein
VRVARYGDVYRHRETGQLVRVYRRLDQRIWFRNMPRTQALTRIRDVEAFEYDYAFVRKDER